MKEFLSSIRDHCKIRYEDQFCKCKKPFQINELNSHCTRCGFQINFKKRAENISAGAFDYNNVPKNWLL